MLTLLRAEGGAGKDAQLWDEVLPQLEAFGGVGCAAEGLSQAPGDSSSSQT